ncbi:phosphatase PAP2 family protein [Prolixibacteraceae bacterium JC049]|nr:phosphatase PAP2 family protein [Prolixibacteraceae bacterium JC049]
MIIENSYKRKKIKDFFRDMTSLGNPFSVLLFILFCTSSYNQLITSLIGLLCIEILCFSIKFFYYKPRPNSEIFTTRFGKMSAGSFPSIHSARISFIFTQLALIKGEFIFFIISFIVIVVVSFSRVFLKKHYIIDVLFGLLIGLLVSFIINSYPLFRSTIFISSNSSFF